MGKSKDAYMRSSQDYFQWQKKQYIRGNLLMKSINKIDTKLKKNDYKNKEEKTLDTNVGLMLEEYLGD